jgi:sporadic carbohydrate cluster protein (TIGR04323 family)
MKLKGYITSRSFLGERVPQHIQNIIIRDYCDKNKYDFLMSATEYSIPESTLMIKQIISELDLIDGIVAYSIFQLPENLEDRFDLIHKIIGSRKQIHFACENMKITNDNEFTKIENIWQIKQIMNFENLKGNK